ncbi:hypothetical protein HDU87_003382 [Geranomyces variabilis]|uniref:Uncharacterized protein n=1 Tax=Geranomyces variabilis TaxID=109894 RepID=A0AAD5XMP9_9FUNG|nr:hypothetical protein HDU87_003382 [Geranomyces variabilis]
MAKFRQAQDDQRATASLAQFPSMRQALMSLFAGDLEWAGFDDNVYGIQLEEACAEEVTAWKVLRLGLAGSPDTYHHERTSWVEKVIPWFSPPRMSGLVKWRWCEFAYGARTTDVDAADDYVTRAPRYADGLGMTPGNVESIVMESSGEEFREDVSHALGDSYKLVENSVLALRHALSASRDASWDTMKDMMAVALALQHSFFLFAVTARHQ